MKFVDTHAHIYLEQFDNDIDEVIKSCQEKGVYKIFTPNIDKTSVESMHHLSDMYPEMIYPMMGLHPSSVDSNFEEILIEIESLLQQGRYYGVGEIGTDLYWDDTFWEQQIKALKIQLGWAKRFKLPAILHSRETLDQNIEFVSEEKSDNLFGIFHCFTGTTEQAEKIIDLGFHIGLGGVATFKNAKLDEMIKKIPLGKIVLETDSPYLAPVPYRGKRNEPSFIPLIAEKIASVKNVSVELVAEKTTQNALEIFSI